MERALEKIAAREGVSVEKVREEIQQAIDIGFSSSEAAVQKQWSKMKYRGKNPTTEEVIKFLAKKVKKETK